MVQPELSTGSISDAARVNLRERVILTVAFAWDIPSVTVKEGLEVETGFDRKIIQNAIKDLMGNELIAQKQGEGRHFTLTKTGETYLAELQSSAE